MLDISHDSGGRGPFGALMLRFVVVTWPGEPLSKDDGYAVGPLMNTLMALVGSVETLAQTQGRALN